VFEFMFKYNEEEEEEEEEEEDDTGIVLQRG
jgi:hypothetical protein